MAGPETEQSSIRTEIDLLRATYGDQCKVIKDVGEFAYLISIKFNNMDLTIKFQIETKYPDTPAQILIRSNKLGDSDRDELMNQMTPELTLPQLTQTVTEWIQRHNLDLTPISSSPRTKKQPKNCKKKEPKADVIEKKALSMKTSEDVIHRILWDENLQSENFIIGYIDRFVGVVEKPFTAFSWENLASLDYDVFAIPKHRIQYFKYKTCIVWDKTTRLDNIFGSTGSDQDILQIISATDMEEEERLAKKEENYYEFDDSDDDIEIDTGCTMSQTPNVPDPDGPVTALYPREKYWGAKIRPTHFLAVRITDQQIKAKVEEMQKLILDLNPEYDECVIPVERQHITLACLGLDTEEHIQTAVEVLKNMKEELHSHNNPRLKITFRNLDQFFNNTLYACVEPNDDFMSFVDHLKMGLSEAGVSLRDVFEFVPHTTIVKLSMQFGREMNTRYLDPRVLQTFGDTYFGSQLLDNIHLCAMSDDRHTDGFYVCPTVINFD